MSEQLAQMIIDNYIASTLALRESSAVPSTEAAVSIDAYRSERMNVFLRWQNAAASLRELPTEYMVHAVAAIDQITA
ncbi:hypothetical protein HUB98_09270 [Paenibacillus barcinonensis]|uniref:Uncharacterized protein n=1 Tax=Paenibacillus barcinonensis TaxID=198119 RepID=A0A2V4VSS8_PAEBA|nr:hypothetical protein [Paenibacillus barcinonensis]PYE49810.1 hypothetical protein DFQ00_105314 [Paenibacillus barcinonensis]QKS56512.1 hypothetical protein HUB98_09270 [Paenibacillus barcinonensis]